MNGDVIEILEQMPVSVNCFNRIRSQLVARGWKPIYDNSGVGCCPMCNAQAHMLIVFQKKGKERWFELCLVCWKVIEQIPVYDGKPSPKPMTWGRKKRTMRRVEVYHNP